MARATTTKTISLEPEVLRKGRRLAKLRGFTNSYSAYIAKLIEDDDRALREQRRRNGNGAKPLEAIHAS